MSLTFRKLHPHFVAEASPIDLRQVTDFEALLEIRAGMDEYALLVFRNQHFTDEEHLAFAQRLDGQLHTKTGISALQKSRLGNEALADVSNLNANGRSIRPMTAGACTAWAIGCGTRTPLSRTRPDATPCSLPESSRPSARTRNMSTCERPMTAYRTQ